MQKGDISITNAYTDMLNLQNIKEKVIDLGTCIKQYLRGYCKVRNKPLEIDLFL
jgi:hypothetical protein